MLIVFWSPKGGSGTTVTTALAALAAGDRDVLLVDTAGDLPDVLGMAERPAPGLREFCVATEAPPDALRRLEVPVAGSIRLLPAGEGGPADGHGPALVAGLLRDDPRLVLADAGRADDLLGAALLAVADRVVTVLRPCYLALRRAQQQAPIRGRAVVVDEPGRALDADDVAECLGVPVAARLGWDPAVARLVDAGLLVRRPPRRALRRLAGVLA